ncbi:MAG: efflux transporter outer membrane subunit [Gammaproteobacteria bacterium]
MYYARMSLNRLILLLLTISLTGCMVGPNYHRQPAPLIWKYNSKHLPNKTVATPGTGKAGVAQQYVNNEDIPAEWWKLFHSEAINSLVTTGISNSPNIGAAYAALRQAQENYYTQIGNTLLPAFDLGGTAQRQLFNASGFGGEIPSSIFNLFNVSVNVSYTLDVFGGARRLVEAFGAQVDYQQFQLIGAYLTMTANIVTTSIAIASVQAQIEATEFLIREAESQLKVLRGQYRLGGISLANVASQEALVGQTRATLPPLQLSLSQNRHALSVLVGEYPGGPLPAIRLSQLTLPKNIPISLPSNMVRQRPDVRASEALLHAASAQVGVATANLLPQFPITGAYGWQAGVPSRLFSTQSNLWNIAAGVTQPLFHGGALLSQRRASIDAYQQALMQYKQTVLQAVQNVADSLRALETDARTLRAQKEAERAAYTNLRLTENQYRLGGVSFINLLTAEQQYQQAKISLIQAEAARYADTAALFQSLGGGWWHKEWCVKQCF